MKIENNTQNTSFGQLVPTKPLLKSAMGIHTYSEGRELYLSTSQKFPGHEGYYKKAVIIAQSAIKKNEKIKELVRHLKEIPKCNLNKEINKIASDIGEKIDISI